MLLSDSDIRSYVASGRVRLKPWDPEMVQPSSVDIHLDRFFRLFDNHKYPVVDPAADQPELTRLIEVSADGEFVLHPGEFVLGATYERVTLADDVAARLEGKSSLGRLGMKVGQLCFFQLSSPAERPYGAGATGSRYQGQRGPTASRSHLNFHRIDVAHDGRAE